MRFVKDAIIFGLAGGIIGIHIYMLMSPKKQKEIERGIRRSVKDLKEASQEMLRIAKSFG